MSYLYSIKTGLAVIERWRCEYYTCSPTSRLQAY